MDFTTSSSFLSPDSENPAPTPMPVAPITPKERPICLVCGDIGELGKRGILRCGPCRNFFSRRMDRMPQPCYAGGNCVINIQTRNECKGCRFRKCLAIGMRKEDHIRAALFSVSVTPLHSMQNSSPTPMPSTGEDFESEVTLSRQLDSGTSICDPEFLFPIQEDCVACEDGTKSKTLTFGVPCCNSCYHFFRRVCTRENKGELLPVCVLKKCRTESLNSCRSCRYQKCLSSGMEPRQLGTNEETDRTNLLNLYSDYLPTQNGENHSQAVSEEAIDFILNHLYSFHPSTQNVQWTKPFSSITQTSNSLECFLRAWEQFSFDIEYGIRKSCDFFNTIPEFELLTQEEIIFLLKKNFFAIYLIRVSRGVSFQQSVFHSGVLDFSTLEVLFGATIFPGSWLAQKIVNFLISLRKEYKEWQLALLIPFLLFQNSEHHEKLVKMEKHFGNVLLQNMKSKPNSISYIMKNILPELNHINLEFNQVLNKLRDNVEFLDLSPMFMELASIENPKTIQMVNVDMFFECHNQTLSSCRFAPYNIQTENQSQTLINPTIKAMICVIANQISMRLH